MKNRSVQAISIGLSAMSLAAPVGMTVYAQEAEVIDEPATKVEVQAESSSEEQAIAEQVSILSEQLNNATTSDEITEALAVPEAEGQYEQQISEIIEDATAAEKAVDSVSAAVDNMIKADEAMEEAQIHAEESAKQANEAAEASKQVSSEANTQADSAVNALNDSNTNKSDAAVIIANTDKTVEEAQTAFDSAEEKYSNALKEYNEAKDDFDVALNAYNKNKEKATADLGTAQSALDSAQSRLADLEKQLETARQELANAGADALIAAEESKGAYDDSYVSSVLQYYYIPNSEGLKDGQEIANLKIVSSDEDSSHLQVSYDVLDAEGIILRSVNADYGYTLSPKEGQVQLFTKELIYQYTNSDGQEVLLTKEEADALGDSVQIANYWTIDGYYLPIYKDYMLYKGTRVWPIYPTSTVAQLSGMSYVTGLYTNDPDIYKASIDFDDDWKTEFQLVGHQFYTTGHFTALFSKISDLPGYIVSENIANARYASEEEAMSAVIGQARAKQGAYTIDSSASKLLTKHYEEYAKIVEKYINVGDALWTNTTADYTSYISSIKSKVSAYENLLSSVANAKKEFTAAQEKVASIKEQLESLGNASDIISVAEMARLKVQLKAAEEGRSEAKANLETAKESLAAAKDIYRKRFSNIKSSGQSSYFYNTVEANAESEQKQAEELEELEELEEEVDEELEEEAEEENQEVDTQSFIAFNNRSNNAGGGAQAGGADAQDEQQTLDEIIPEQPETITIPEEEEVPLAITLAGVLEHGKWFAGLAGVGAAGGGVAIFEAKRRAAAKIIDKLNQ